MHEINNLCHFYNLLKSPKNTRCIYTATAGDYLILKDKKQSIKEPLYEKH